jgi:phosphatidylethanolamine-binding protein (PEBP) family uncharacterized protein
MGLSKLFFWGKSRRQRRKQRRVTRRKKYQHGGEFSVAFQGKEAKGNLRARSETLAQPIVSWNAIPGKLYTVLMWDPDAPASSWIHLFVVNTPSSNLTQGQTILSYEPPTPPSGIHRYFVSVFEQPQMIDVPIPSERGNFDVSAFVEKHRLQKIGEKMIRVRA